MSKITISEAIKQQIKAAEAFEKSALEKGVSELTREGRKKVANEHRQLAKWLKELKELREENINLKNDNDRLRDCVDSCVHNGELDYAELAEAKRLLKTAVDDLNEIISVRHDNAQWRYTDEALKLIGENTDETNT